MGDSSYLLGTHAEELERLRFQHELWLPAARAAWQRAGLTAGMRVLDVGAGVGHWKRWIEKNAKKTSYRGTEVSDAMCKEHGFRSYTFDKK